MSDNWGYSKKWNYYDGTSLDINEKDLLVDFMTIRYDDEDDSKLFRIVGEDIMIENVIVRGENIIIKKIELIGKNITIGRIVFCGHVLNVGDYILNGNEISIDKKMFCPIDAKIECEGLCVLKGYKDWTTLDLVDIKDDCFVSLYNDQYTFEMNGLPYSDIFSIESDDSDSKSDEEDDTWDIFDD